MIEQDKRMKELQDSLGSTNGRWLQLSDMRRIRARLVTTSSECSVCRELIEELDERVDHAADQNGNVTRQERQAYTRMVSRMKHHLQKQHGLISDGYYGSLYMALGVSVGLLIGGMLFESIVFGLPIGIGIGLALGAGMDKRAQRQGKVL
ncbi:hypothetical protein [Alkalicoccus urumqiensis]|uniref:Uncharacterized protein n=1 Tax=Alkalicoccus urumqiensis TaxID=1548213 RepID=A0A2P6ME18_ALKUR|nr:hypothetical protein [Alkalicoccus urumqiensis]PRO64529.1 hypothetical protein C6I21_14500 [Alkalicoccus urumqiensis]